MKDTAADGSALPSIILGLTDKGHLRRFPFEKNLLSVAGAGAGKGATQIILNLRLGWEHNAVVIDPSGEAAEAAISWRDQGHDETAWNYEREIAVIDPYEFANVPYYRRASFNPLDLVESAADLRNLASGLITRTDTDKGHWVDSAEDVAAGLLAFILQDSELADDERHIGQLRHYIGTLSDPATKAGTIEAMKSCEGYGGLAMDIAKRLSPDNTETQNILGTLRTQTRWLNSEEVVAALSKSRFNGVPGATGKSELGPMFDFRKGRRFDLRDIKNRKLDVFLVVPGDRIQEDGIFLRLFVRAMLSIMMKKAADGDQMGERCLFILDECFAIGHLKELTFASGQMRKYGLHLWPFFQSVAQITDLYGRDGLEILSEDADALMVFGARGSEIMDYASKRLGRITEQDIWDDLSAAERAVEEDERAQVRPYVWEVFSPLDGRILTDRQKKLKAETLRSRIGNPRFTPDDLRALLSKPQDAAIAGRMLVMHGAGYEFVKPLPYFDLKNALDEAEKLRPAPPSRWLRIRPWVNIGLIALILIIPPLRDTVLGFLAAGYVWLFGWLPSYVQFFGFLALLVFGTAYLISRAVAHRIGGDDMVRRLKSWWLTKIFMLKTPMERQQEKMRGKPRRPGIIRSTVEMAFFLAFVVLALGIMGVVDLEQLGNRINLMLSQ